MKDIKPLIDATVQYLASSKAQESLETDPYWPKWDSPWWQMVLLFEMGEARRIPEQAALKMIEVVNSHYVRHFPFTASDLPEGKDAYLHVPCHCALGTIFQVIAACGSDPDKEFPWIRPWFLRYQLEDGGLNCDERAYTGSRKSSVVSTLPPLESVLFCTERDFTPAELKFLDNGARYLIEHRLACSKSSGEFINENWLNLCFPRFYEYDILRGMRYLVGWANRCGRHLPPELLSKSFLLIQQHQPKKEISAMRHSYAGARTRRLLNGSWQWADASTFPLLEAVSKINVPCPFLEREILRVRDLPPF